MRIYKPKYGDIRIHCDTEKTFTILIFDKNASLISYGVICFLECHKLHVSPKIRLATDRNPCNVGMTLLFAIFRSYWLTVYLPISFDSTRNKNYGHNGLNYVVGVFAYINYYLHTKGSKVLLHWPNGITIHTGYTIYDNNLHI